MKVMLHYTFIFDPDETWARQDSFDSSLAGLFKQVGLQAEMVETPGDDTNKTLIITRATQVPNDEEDLKEKRTRKMRQEVGQKIREKGRFVKQ